MRVHSALFPVAIVAFALSSAIAATAEQRRGRDRDTQEATGQAHERARGRREPRDGDVQAPAAAPQREPQESRTQRDERQAPGALPPAAPPDRAERAVPRDRGRNEDGPRGGAFERGGMRQDNRGDSRNDRRDDRAVERRADRRDDRSDRRDDRWDRRDDRWDNRRNDRWDGRDGYRYRPPRVIAPRRGAPRRYYGPGGNFSVYFGWGSGYRFGNWYSGRVYGYVPPQVAYGVRRYYGDVRLQVRPRFAEVYVDGYYAGIVDSFDGVFQRLTLEVGPHEIEIVAPGYEPQYYEVYVDPYRTVDLFGDLYPSGYPGRPY